MNRSKAALYGMGAALGMSLMATLARFVAPDTNNSMLVFFRFSIGFLYIIFLLYRKNRGSVRQLFYTNHHGLHFIRAILSVTAVAAFYYSLLYIPLVDANLLVMSNILFIPIFTAILFRTKTSWKSWIIITIGFFGIALVIKPTTSIFNPYAWFAILSAITVALSLIAIKELSKKDSSDTIMAYYSTLAFIFSLLMAIFNWKTPSLYTVLILAGVSLLAVGDGAIGGGTGALIGIIGLVAVYIWGIWRVIKGIMQVKDGLSFSKKTVVKIDKLKEIERTKTQIEIGGKDNVGKPVNQAPVNQAPVNQAPVNQAPVNQAPVAKISSWEKEDQSNRVQTSEIEDNSIELESLHRDGVLTDAEYEAAKKTITVEKNPQLVELEILHKNGVLSDSSYEAARNRVLSNSENESKINKKTSKK